MAAPWTPLTDTRQEPSVPQARKVATKGFSPWWMPIYFGRAIGTQGRGLGFSTVDPANTELLHPKALKRPHICAGRKMRGKK